MTIARWTAALRIARRDLWHGTLRATLVLALIGVPILLLTAADTLHQTYTLSPEREATALFGRADAQIDWENAGPIQQQSAGAGAFTTSATNAAAHGPAPSAARLQASLPPGSRVVPFRHQADPATFYTPYGLSNASLIGLDYTDPAAAGMVRQDAGRAPRTTDEIAISRAVAHDTGLGVGDRLRTTDPARTFRIVGIVTEPTWLGATDLYTLPAALPASAAMSDNGVITTSWLVASPSPLTARDTAAINRLGCQVMTRVDYLGPSPASTAPSTKAIATGTLVGGMVLLEIVLLAGPAFAVGARRRRRELALVAAVGGSRGDLRRIVLADALLIGLSAGVLGVSAGIGLAAVVEPHVERFADALPGPFDVPWTHLAGLVLVSLATALAAALAPAVRAARTDVVAALAGRRGEVRTHPRVPLIGTTVAALGVVIVLGTVGTPTAQSVLLGVALIEVGVVTMSPWIVAAVAALARWLPVSGRIALRDASRNRTAAASAVAAVMACVIGAMAAGIGTASAAARNRNDYYPQLPRRDTYVGLGSHPADAARVEAALRGALPGAPLTVVRGPTGSCDGAADSSRPCTVLDARYLQGVGSDSVAFTGALPNVLVVDPGSPSELDSLLGTHDAAAAAALAAGSVLVTDAVLTSHGRMTLEALRLSGGRDGVGPAHRHTVSAPATVLRSGYTGFSAIVPTDVFARLGVASAAVGVLASTDHSITAAQRQALAAGLARTGHVLQTTSETGYSDPSLWLPLVMVAAAALIAVLAALIATALANVDSRPDLVLLGAVGASPHTRRVLSFARAAVIAGIGTVVGVLAGLLPARAWVQSVGAPVVIPWSAVASAVVGIPLLAAVLAWACTRARLPSERAA